jgi:hypothetical protein
MKAAVEQVQKPQQSAASVRPFDAGSVELSIPASALGRRTADAWWNWRGRCSASDIGAYTRCCVGGSADTASGKRRRLRPL